MIKDISVRKSEIHGKGVFANRDFKKGELILKWKPKVLKKEDLKKISKKEEQYIFHAGGDVYFLKQTPERFVNHSCKPNMYVKDHCEYAKRDIKSGEELTTNYFESGDKDENEFVCKCGDKKCKKYE